MTRRSCAGSRGRSARTDTRRQPARVGKHSTRSGRSRSGDIRPAAHLAHSGPQPEDRPGRLDSPRSGRTPARCASACAGPGAVPGRRDRRRPSCHGCRLHCAAAPARSAGTGRHARRGCCSAGSGHHPGSQRPGVGAPHQQPAFASKALAGAGHPARQGPRPEDRLRPRPVRPGLGRRRPQRLRHPQRHAPPRPHGHRAQARDRGTASCSPASSPTPTRPTAINFLRGKPPAPPCRSTTSSPSATPGRRARSSSARHSGWPSPTTR